MNLKTFFYLIISSLLVFVATSSADNLYQPLKPKACVDVNGYLDQINVASIINIKPSGNLTALVEYRNNKGVLLGSVSKNLKPGEKVDLLVNDMGLLPDTIGALCVTTNSTTDGTWAGSITIYRPSLGSLGLGGNFDWALYRPITNSLLGSSSASVNTIRIGMSNNSFVANWISIGDATPGDNKRLRGVLEYRGSNGQVIATQNVDIADGGVAAFGSHVIFGPDAVGTAVFLPEDGAALYSFSNARYFYDCSSGACSLFHTAFILPPRPAVTTPVVSGASTLKNEISVVEVVNLAMSIATLSIDLYSGEGVLLKTLPVSVPAYGTRHFVLNSFDPNGAFPDETIGSIRAVVSSGEVSINSMFYHVNKSGYLEYAYTAPAAGQAGANQISQFNSFINHKTELEIVNIGDAALFSDVGFFEYTGFVVWLRHGLSIPAHGTKRLTVFLPRDTYGSVLFKNSHSQVAARVYSSRAYQYTVPYFSQPSGTALPEISGELVAKYIRIMPLGDSITESIVGYSSYRYWLWNSLVSSGIGADFVGNRYGVKDGAPKFPDFDQDHQGQSGARADVMLAKLPSLMPLYDPDVYLVHLGSNDIFQGFSVDPTIVDLRNIIERIRSHNPLAVILLAKIIPAEKEGAKIKELSGKIGALEDMSTISSPVLIVDQFKGFNLATDSYDNKHPNDAGEQKMSGKWYNALVEYLFG